MFCQSGVLGLALISRAIEAEWKRMRGLALGLVGGVVVLGGMAVRSSLDQFYDIIEGSAPGCVA